MKFKRWIILTATLILLPAEWSAANPTQYGDSGLFSQPTAETLNAGNICLGLWANCAAGEDERSTLVPVSLTLGLGTFIEMYGSYPNLLFNGDEGDIEKAFSRRGYANLGMKIRVIGKRAAPFKLAADLQARRSIADDPEYDGITDYLGRLVASYKSGGFGIHVNGGYIDTGDSDPISSEDQIIYGGGVEFYPVQRLRLLAEIETQSSRVESEEDPLEATAGFQYFLSPHLTINLGVGYGLSDASPEWRVLAGFSTCQGVGTYSKPIPRKIEPVKEEAPPSEPVKVMKVRTLTPLIPKASPSPTEDSGGLEVPIESTEEEVLLLPSEKLLMPESAYLAALPTAAITSEESAVALAAKTAKDSVTSLAETPIRAMLYRRFRMPEFTYTYDQSNLSPAGEAAIIEIAEQLRKENKSFILKIDGHTDSIGTENYNLRLSQKRAISAATALVIKAGFDPNRIFLRGYGEENPIASNNTDEGRAENRRVEVMVLLPKDDAR